ncbi:19720_t:CDS:2 [Entrophospora sp. SA101]|nr:36_t:CDS:2 [Entrophospora sp. SA101]CAJ0753244.1 19720_t:CDS:2 [Entrophospora sp. SA101]CAJ0830213.1 909_t:CDS:2 [Entrophospora sp. SA101]CAJ0913006.1 6761_t:CDS:2 [Entrophospora sp. SA101]
MSELQSQSNQPPPSEGDNTNDKNNSNNNGGSGGAKKPDEHINLKVVGNVIFFRIKRTTQLKKLMDAYCERQGKSLASLRFLYDGDRVQSHNTPADLDMEDGDSIDVMVEQLGL